MAAVLCAAVAAALLGQPATQDELCAEVSLPGEGGLTGLFGLGGCRAVRKEEALQVLQKRTRQSLIGMKDLRRSLARFLGKYYAHVSAPPGSNARPMVLHLVGRSRSGKTTAGRILGEALSSRRLCADGGCTPCALLEHQTSWTPDETRRRVKEQLKRNAQSVLLFDDFAGKAEQLTQLKKVLAEMADGRFLDARRDGVDMRQAVLVLTSDYGGDDDNIEADAEFAELPIRGGPEEDSAVRRYASRLHSHYFGTGSKLTAFIDVLHTALDLQAAGTELVRQFVRLEFCSLGARALVSDADARAVFDAWNDAMVGMQGSGLQDFTAGSLRNDLRRALVERLIDIPQLKGSVLVVRWNPSASVATPALLYKGLVLDARSGGEL